MISPELESLFRTVPEAKKEVAFTGTNAVEYVNYLITVMSELGANEVWLGKDVYERLHMEKRISLDTPLRRYNNVTLRVVG